MEKVINKPQKLELDPILRSVRDSINFENLHPFQQKAYTDLISCRTSTLGGHRAECNNCHHYRNAYNSCRNRHCPKCQMLKKVVWVDKLKGNLPAVKHFHIVFTVPESLNKLFYINQRISYDALFQAAGKTLIQCAENNDYLGAKAGAIGVLHTWGQTLSYHPHVHMIVPSGGLTEDGFEWIPSHKKFFLSVRVLSAVFRGVLIRLLEKEHQKGQLKLPDDVSDFKQIKDLAYNKKWVVYCEKPFATPDAIINYLGNYTHRVAISNHRLISHEAGKVSFRYKNYANQGQKRSMTLEENEFVRRFLQHILPTGFCKIRYFGFLSLRFLRENIDKCTTVIARQPSLSKYVGLNAYEVLRELTKKDPLLCSHCKKGHYVIRKSIAKAPS